MGLIWPPLLAALLIVPALVVAYVWLVRRRDAALARLGALRLTEGATGRRAAWRRHLPPALFLVAIALLLFALARPTATVALPHREGTVILAFDVSTSMLADDLKPSRINAAKTAASAFVRKQPSTIQIGVVAFSDTALVLQQPTNVQGDVLAAIDRIAPQGGTSLAQGIFSSLGAIEGKPLAVPTPDANAAPDATPDLSAVDIGYHGSAVIVLLSDGEDTTRTDPSGVDQLAANAGVRIDPIGVGSTEGTTMEIEGYRISTALNEPLLQQIATDTGGTYFHAADAAELSKIYGSIDLGLTIRGQQMEVTPLIAVGAMLLLVIGAGLTMRWFGRVP
jgi:Ca-activated chloride channel family protein